VKHDDPDPTRTVPVSISLTELEIVAAPLAEVSLLPLHKCKNDPDLSDASESKDTVESAVERATPL
jgi:hypothetical protein